MAEDYKNHVPKLLGLIVLVGVVSLVIIFFLVLSSEEEGVVRNLMLKTPILKDMVARKENELISDSVETEDLLNMEDEDETTEIGNDATSIDVDNSEIINIDSIEVDDSFLSPSDVTREGEKAFLSLKLKEAREIFLKNQQEDAVANFYLGIISSFEQDLNSVKVYFARVNELSTNDLLNVKSKEILKAFDEYNLYPGSSQDHLKVLLGRAYINLGFVNLGIVKIKEALKINPNYKDAYVILGAAYMMLENYDEAINFLTKAIPTDRSEPNYYLGLAYFNKQKYYEAILSFREAVDLGYHPEEELRKKLGESLLAIGKYDESLVEFNRLIDINPLNDEFYYQPIWVNLKVSQNAQKALSYAELCLSNNPKSARCHDYVGWVYLEASEFEIAKKYLDASIALDSNLSSTNFHLAKYYEAFGDFFKAENHFRKVIEIDPDSEYAKDAENEIKKYL